MSLLHSLFGRLSDLLKIYLVSLVDCISVLNVISVNLLFFSVNLLGAFKIFPFLPSTPLKKQISNVKLFMSAKRLNKFHIK